jgi:ABC-2 type transport system ATP-binding protein
MIKFDNLTKYYGPILAVDNVSLDIEQGEIFGYLGPNGSGKTTTIRCMMDFIRPSSGVITVEGKNSVTESKFTRSQIGYVPSDPVFYDRSTGDQVLNFVDSIYNVDSSSFRMELSERLDCDLSRKISTLSRGNRQKIALIRAFMFKPSVLVLDEPTTGLDPLIQREFNEIIKELRENGTTVFLSSHVLSEVEELCDRVGILNVGGLVALETMGDIKSRAVRQIEIEFESAPSQKEFNDITGLDNIVLKDRILTADIRGDFNGIIKAASKYSVLNIVTREPNLDEIFLEYYQGSGN